jgi:hypothetical protein
MSIRILRQHAMISQTIQTMFRLLIASKQLRFISTESNILQKCPLGMLILKTKIFQGARRRAATMSRTTTRVRFAYLGQLKKSEITHRLFIKGLASLRLLATALSRLSSCRFQPAFLICNAASILQASERGVSTTLAAFQLAQH